MNKKKALSFYCITFMLFCQPFLCCLGANALSDEQKSHIVNHCDTMRESLKKLQSYDSRARVYYGSYYEKFLNRFIKPLNHRLVDNNISTYSTELTASQALFSTNRTNFNDDFIDYQKSLEELIGTDCKNNPEDFYRLLEIVRERRRTMNSDIEKNRSAIKSHLELVKKLKEAL